MAPSGQPVDGGIAPEVPEQVARQARAARRVCVLTGAGMSAESGVPTFRGTRSGLWERFDPAQLATPQAWRADPPLVNAWYLWRVALVRAAQPHAGHLALAAWARRPGVDVRIVTQNVDDLHERAGSVAPTHLHGSLFAWRCDRCGAALPTPEVPTDAAGGPLERIDPTPCPHCSGHARPGVVWFGEPLPAKEFREAEETCRQADLVLVVGTSGLVYPAAGLPAIAAGAGVPVVEIDPNPTELTLPYGAGPVHWRDRAGVALPALLAALGR